MKNNFIKSTISIFAMMGLVTTGAYAYADHHGEHAGARAGAAVDRTGDRVEAGAERAGNKASKAANRAADKTSNAASRTGDKAERLGEDVEGSAARTGDNVQGSANRAGRNVDRSADRAGNSVQGSAARAEAGADEAGDNTGVRAEVSDTWITTKVKSSFIGEESLGESDISVDTEQGGVVTLSGTVRNKAAKRHAERLAKNVDGVRSVKNELKVVSTRNVSGRD